MTWLARLFARLGAGRQETPLEPPAPAAGGVPVSTVAEGAGAPPLPREAMLTPRDRKRLEGVHPDLVRVVERARRDVVFFVAEGVRTVERQRDLVKQGFSRTMDSRHLTGHAVDLYPVSDVPVPSMTGRDLAPVVSAMRRAAAAEGVRMVHGADWGWDHPHHELDRRAYP